MILLYEIFIKEFMRLGYSNPIYQEAMLNFFDNGLSWDIKKFKELECTSELGCEITEIRLLLDTSVSKVHNTPLPSFLREVDYLRDISFLIGYNPNLFRN